MGGTINLALSNVWHVPSNKTQLQAEAEGARLDVSLDT